MNYYSPYFNMYPRLNSRRLFSGGIKWSSIFNNTQKALNFINQAIPVVKQVSPIVRNAKTMFRVMNEFKKVDNNSNISSNNSVNNKSTDDKNYDGTPTFFI